MRQQPRRLDLRRHVGELELDRLMLGDRLAKGPPLLRIAQRQLQRPLRDPDATSGDVHPAELERVHHLHKSLAKTGSSPPKTLAAGRPVAVEHQLGRLDPLVAKLRIFGGTVRPLKAPEFWRPPAPSRR